MVIFHSYDSLPEGNDLKYSNLDFMHLTIIFGVR